MPERDFTTYSGIEVDPVYGPAGAERPGEYPYTRGPYAEMYRSKLWTMRMFAGFGTPTDTNQRFKEILAAGGDGLSTAFDLPTLMGRDSDDPLAIGEVGKCGVAIDTLADVEDLYRDIDLGTITTSMTINSPAPVLFAMYVAAAEKTGVDAGAARRHAAERHAEGVPGAEGVRVPAAPEDAAGERRRPLLQRGDAEVAPDLDLRVPHPRSRLDGRAGARVHRRQRVRVRRGRARGRARHRRVRAAPLLLLQRARRLLRGDREVPRRPPHLGPLAARALRREAGTVDAAAVPHPDRGRVAHRAAARGQPRAHRDRGARGRARRHPEPAHQLVRRGARAPDREGGPPRDPHAAGDRVRDPHHERRRPARRLLVRRGAHRRDGAPGRGDLRPRRGARRRVDARGRARRHRGGLVPVRDLEGRVRPRAQAQRRPPRRWSASPTSSRATTTRRRTSSRSAASARRSS